MHEFKLSPVEKGGEFAPKTYRSWADFIVHEQKNPKFVGGSPIWIDLVIFDVDEAEAAAEATSTLRPGPYARESVPASGPKINRAEQKQIDAIGNARGRHICGV